MIRYYRILNRFIMYIHSSNDSLDNPQSFMNWKVNETKL